jgi:hypothetical protein|tara:strand:- start:10078 stop:10236 length:159 start_codon:yes stop_codon:yes gene_type:complete
MKTKYSWKIGLWKGVSRGIIFAVPIFVLAFPTWAELSIGGALMMLVNFIKNK